MNTRWKPHVTVAAVIEQGGKFLLVEEQATDGLRLNNPAGHLDCGESPVQACIRETLEETAYHFAPTHLLGIYLSRQTQPVGTDITYMRFAFRGTLGTFVPERTLDTGIVRTLWLTPNEIRASVARHRSPMVLQCLEDYLRGVHHPLDLVFCHASVTAGSEPNPNPQAAST